VSLGKSHERAEDMPWLTHYDVPERASQLRGQLDCWLQRDCAMRCRCYGSAYSWGCGLTRTIRHEVDQAGAFRSRWWQDIALYHGDELIDRGTIKEIAERRGVRRDRIWWYLTGAGR
jgi:hypothetical protein